MRREDALTALSRWFAARHAEGASPAPADDLLEGAWLDSLGVLDLLLHLEQLRDGKPVDVRALQPGQLRSLNALLQHFLEVDDA